MPVTGTDLKERINSFIFDLKNSKLEGEYQIAYETVQILRRIVSKEEWRTAKELMDLVKEEGCRMIDADRCETAVGNMVRRLLKIIREEYVRSARGTEEGEGNTQESLQNLLMSEESVDDYSKTVPDLREEVINAIDELITLLEGSVEDIAALALEHIHSNEIIFTMGKSRTVEAFLKKASKKRKFQVFVMECAPSCSGKQMGRALAEAGIETTVITDAAVFAVIKRVNKVIIGTHTVLADGGLKAWNGAMNVAATAQHHSVPVIVCAPMYKLSNTYYRNEHDFHKFQAPQGELDFSGDEILSKVTVINPTFDYVPPDLVSLFITNEVKTKSSGGFSTDYIYRLQEEMYHKDDENLEANS